MKTYKDLTEVIGTIGRPKAKQPVQQIPKTKPKPQKQLTVEKGSVRPEPRRLMDVLGAAYW